MIDDDYYTGDDGDLFGRRKAQEPFKAIILALLLMICGAALLTVGALLYVGKLSIGAEGDVGKGSVPFFVVGCLTFIPGFYHVRIGYYAWYRRDGFDFAEIPEL
jgi:hypothetical protein